MPGDRPRHDTPQRRQGAAVTTTRGPVMVVAAHPDDPEFLMGGTVARLAREGREVTYVIVTNGNKGSGDRRATSAQLAPIREEEQRRAAVVLGVTRVEFLGHEDGELEDTRDVRRDITRQIRRWRPELIITLSPRRTYGNFPGWHRDHRTTGRVVLDCVYPLARDHLAFPELIPEAEPHMVREVYVVQWEQPSLLVDITDTMDLKLKAIRCHASQVTDPAAMGDRMRHRAAALGKAKEYTYAEGFDHIVVPG
jgi:LmbE family N-acetylglucosaminyl deacetylase